MPIIVCNRQCIWRDRLWEVGETLDIVPGVEYPRHFSMQGEPPRTETRISLPTRTCDVLIICGNAPGLGKDLQGLKLHGQPHAFMAINRAAHRVKRPLTYWVSFHHDLFPGWRKDRDLLGFKEDIIFLSNENDREFKEMFAIGDIPKFNGGSALLGLHFGIKMNFPKIILAGVELQDEGYDHLKAGWRRYTQSLSKDRLDGIRGLSGLPLELYGKPTKMWLEA